MLGRVDEALATLEAMRALSREPGDDAHQAALDAAYQMGMHTGDLAEARRQLEELLAVVDRVGAGRRASLENAMADLDARAGFLGQAQRRLAAEAEATIGLGDPEHLILLTETMAEAVGPAHPLLYAQVLGCAKATREAEGSRRTGVRARTASSPGGGSRPSGRDGLGRRRYPGATRTSPTCSGRSRGCRSSPNVAQSLGVNARVDDADLIRDVLQWSGGPDHRPGRRRPGGGRRSAGRRTWSTSRPHLRLGGGQVVDEEVEVQVLGDVASGQVGGVSSRIVWKSIRPLGPSTVALAASGRVTLRSVISA